MSKDTTTQYRIVVTSDGKRKLMVDEVKKIVLNTRQAKKADIRDAYESLKDKNGDMAEYLLESIDE